MGRGLYFGSMSPQETREYRRRLEQEARKHPELVEAAVAKAAKPLWEAFFSAWVRWFMKWAKKNREALEHAAMMGERVEFSAEPPKDLEKAIEQSLQELGSLFASKSPAFWASLRRGLEEATMRWWGRYTGEPIQNAVLKGLQEGLGFSGAIQAVMEAVGRRYHEAERVVRTEVSRAANQDRLAGYIRAGATHVVWTTAQDHRVRGKADPHARADHARLHGQVRRIGEPFMGKTGSLMRWPGDRGLGARPEEVINCRCTLLPVWKKAPKAPAIVPPPEEHLKPLYEGHSIWALNEFEVAGLTPNDGRVWLEAISNLLEKHRIPVPHADFERLGRAISHAVLTEPAMDYPEIREAMVEYLEGYSDTLRLPISALAKAAPTDTLYKAGNVFTIALRNSTKGVKGRPQYKYLTDPSEKAVPKKAVEAKVQKAFDFLSRLLNREVELKTVLYKQASRPDTVGYYEYGSWIIHIAYPETAATLDYLGDTVAHELGHWIEDAFQLQLEARRAVQRLGHPLGDASTYFRPFRKGVATIYEGPWEQFYAGVVFDHGPTEWVSTGIEELYRAYMGKASRIWYYPDRVASIMRILGWLLAEAKQ